MIVIAHPARRTTPNARNQFVKMLPQIKRQARLAFAAFNSEAREELVAEVVANAFVAFVRLVQLGKQAIAYATPLAWFAIKQVRSGRRVGSRLHQSDVMSPANRSVTVERLERFERLDGVWTEALVEDRHAGPAEIAASRLDLAMWLGKLPRRNRKIAKALASGDSTNDVAKQYGLSAGRVSQLRRELEESWQELQGELVVA